VVLVRLRREAVALCAVPAVVAATVLALVSTHYSFVARATAVIPLAWAALAGIVTWWLRGRDARAVGTTAAQADTALIWLAGETASRWRQEAVTRRIVTPAPASVRWRWATEELSIPVRDAAAMPPPGTGPKPLPTLAGPAELLTTGVVTRLHDEVYARLPHGRLVLVGGPGAGKTGAMILLLLAALDRLSMLDAPGALVPVPVWLTMGGWNSLSVPLAEWVIGVLNRDYPALRAAQYGGDAAGMLLRSGRLALFLDGLDEMPPDLRAAAVRRLNNEGKNVRMVLTSRPAEYRLALDESTLDNGAVIELRPIRPDAAAAYLLRGQSGPGRARWQRFAGYLKANPSSVLATALDNPLALSLARDAYVTDDPSVLADSRKFSTAEGITSQLIDQFLHASYPDEHYRAYAVRWLSWIAARMGTSQDLRWWDIPTWVPRWRLRLARGLLAGTAAWALITLAAWLIYRQKAAFSPAPGIAAWAAPGYSIGIAVAVTAGLVFPLNPVPAGMRRRVREAGFPAAASTPLGPSQEQARSSRIRRQVAPEKLALAVVGVAAICSLVFFPAIFLLVCAIGILAMLATDRGRVMARNNWRRALIFLMTCIGRAVLLGVAAGIASGLWAASLDADWATFTGGGFYFGAVFLIWPALALGTKGFGRIGVPRSLVPRWPRPVWLFPLWLVLSPLLIPRWLARWAVPAADFPSATAATTYQTDRRTSAVYASVYAALMAMLIGFPLTLAFTSVFTSAPVDTAFTTPIDIRLLLQWSGIIAAATWFMSWLGAGQVPLVYLTQLVLLPRHGRVSFRRLLNEALNLQVLRQAGAVYQFRHAALQDRLAEGTSNEIGHEYERKDRRITRKLPARSYDLSSPTQP